MKIFTKNIAIDGRLVRSEVFLCSIISNKQYESLYKLLIILVQLNLFNKFILDWSSDNCFEFDVKDILIFFNETETISDDELEVLKKFNIRGCDIFELLKNDCKERITDYNFEKDKYVLIEQLTKEDIEKIKPYYIKLFSEKAWNEIV